MSTSTNNEVRTSIIGEAPEITAPARLEGQSNSEVLFNWLLVNRYLWMLVAPFDEELDRVVGERAGFHLAYKMSMWKRDRKDHTDHPSLAAPESEDARRAAFDRLDRLIRIHLLDGNSSDTSKEDLNCDK